MDRRCLLPARRFFVQFGLCAAQRPSWFGGAVLGFRHAGGGVVFVGVWGCVVGGGVEWVGVVV